MNLKNEDKIEQLELSLVQNKISRRNFVKMAVVLGMSLSTAKLTAKSLGDAAITQLYNSKNLQKEYDYIVVGTGAAGALIAGRLANETNASILVLEAGSTDQIDEVINPSLWPKNIRSERDWMYTAEPSEHVNGRSVMLPMGKVVGGGTSVNVMLWARGHKSDFEFWANETGNDAWSYKNVLSMYKRMENYQGIPDRKRRGTGGKIWVGPVENPHPIGPALLKAAKANGHRVFDDTNGKMMEKKGGAALTDLIIKDGRRKSMASAYLYGALNNPNITLLTGATVLKVNLKNTKVTGLVFEKDGKEHIVNANKRVVLSAGAMNSPKILMQSGIGRSQDLKPLGIKPLHDLQGVGQSFQDHVLAGGCVWEYKNPIAPRGNFAEANVFCKSNNKLDTPDIQLVHIQVPYATQAVKNDYPPIPNNSWSLAVGLARPLSTGSIKLRSSNPKDGLIADAGYLKEAGDLTALVRGFEIARELGNSKEMSEFVKREVLPGKLNKKDMINYIRNATGTYFHQSCTCKMGTDKMSVVDGNLSVYGLENISIADASVMPRISTGNTMAPTVLIGQRMADILIGGLV